MFDHKITMSREQLYSEIWELSLSGVSKKYNASYAGLVKLCRENLIPVPPSGYWTCVEFGKPVEKTPLLDFPVDNIVLPDSVAMENKQPEPSEIKTPVIITPMKALDFLTIEERNRVLLAAGQ